MHGFVGNVYIDFYLISQIQKYARLFVLSVSVSQQTAFGSRCFELSTTGKADHVFFL